jgi:hypothetical protein
MGAILRASGHIQVVCLLGLFRVPKRFQTELAHPSGSEGFFETPDQWLTRLKADVIIAFFGYNESFQGEAGT